VIHSSTDPEDIKADLGAAVMLSAMYTAPLVRTIYTDPLFILFT